MGSVHSLMPKPPQRDMVKLFGKAGQALRFTAQFKDPKPEDQDRLFVVSYFLSDDTISIHEPPQRNLGIVTGRYLEKAIHMNQMTGQLFQPGDLKPGQSFKVYNREFMVIDCDEYTRKHLEHGGNKRNFNLQAVLEKIRESMRQQYPLARDIFRKFDQDKDGVLTREEFMQVLHKWTFQVTDDEALVLMRHFDVHGDGQVGYNEFCDALLDEDYTQQMLKMKPPLNEEFDPAYAQRVQMREEERQEVERVRTAMRSIGQVVTMQGRMPIRLSKEFIHLTHKPTVTCDEICIAFANLGHSFDVEDVRRAVMHVLPGVDPEAVHYVDFVKAMTASFHDFSGKR